MAAERDTRNSAGRIAATMTNATRITARASKTTYVNTMIILLSFRTGIVCKDHLRNASENMLRLIRGKKGETESRRRAPFRMSAQCLGRDARRPLVAAHHPRHDAPWLADQ